MKSLKHLLVSLIFYCFIFSVVLCVQDKVIGEMDFFGNYVHSAMNRMKRETSPKESGTSSVSSPAVPVGMQDVLKKLAEMSSKMSDLEQSLKGVPVLLDLVKGGQSNVCEKVTNLEQVITYFHRFSSGKTDYWPWDKNETREFAAQFRRWGKVFSLCDFPVDQIYGDARFTALDFAAGFDDLDAAQLLIRKGADVHHKDNFDHSPIYFAAYFDSPKVLKVLLENRVNPNDRLKGYYPIQLAAFGKAAKSVEVLVNNGADVHGRDGDNFTVLDYAKDVQVAEFLINNGADPSQRGNQGNTPLHVALDSGKPTNLIELFIKKSSNINVKNDKGETPLLLAVSKGITPDYNIIKLLIDNGADVLAKNNIGETLLHLSAAEMDAVPIMKLLVEKGLKVNIQDDEGNTPLHRSTSQISDENAKFLIENGADINARRKDGKTPLHLAATVIYFWVPDEYPLKFLLSKNASVNAQDNKGRTALHEAAQALCMYCARILLKNGIDPLLKDHDGKTAYQLLLDSDIEMKSELVDFLKNYPH